MNSSRPPETMNAGEIPDGWTLVNLGDQRISEIILGQSPPSTTYNRKGEGVPFLQGNAEFGDTFPTPLIFCSAPKKRVRAHDILISVRAPVGDVNIAPFECCIGRGLAGIRGREGVLDQKYLFYSLRRNANSLQSLSTGSTFKAVRKQDIERLAILLPPLPEQRQVASILTTVDTRLDLLRRRKERLRRIKRGLMNDLLTGRRRVRLEA